jgi:hypothetical protein
MSCRRPGEAWSLPAFAAPALAFSARRHGAEKLSRCGDRFRQQAVCARVKAAGPGERELTAGGAMDYNLRLWY